MNQGPPRDQDETTRSVTSEYDYQHKKKFTDVMGNTITRNQPDSRRNMTPKARDQETEPHRCLDNLRSVALRASRSITDTKVVLPLTWE